MNNEVKALIGHLHDRRARRPERDGAFHIEVDGANVTGTIAVPNTGGWQAWRTVSVAGVPIASGAHTVKVVMDTNGSTCSVAHFNWVQVG